MAKSKSKTPQNYFIPPNRLWTLATEIPGEISYHILGYMMREPETTKLAIEGIVYDVLYAYSAARMVVLKPHGE